MYTAIRWSTFLKTYAAIAIQIKPYLPLILPTIAYVDKAVYNSKPTTFTKDQIPLA